MVARTIELTGDGTMLRRGVQFVSAIVLAALSLGLAPAAGGSDLEDLAREGYAVVAETQVDGEFEGCDFDKRVPFTNGLIFVCSVSVRSLTS